ncbi:enoyl-CoA hydratase [Paracoccus sp. SM22M-07]|uniref:enoyl-CoA hydratase n=1 Tax=Paracoccus sp. SM22M-07 TaxID=1520813 RepID=UPI00091BFC66|nr:enoyl-CoA hydratase [Paracoccus sp. SM22M-07]OJH45745.1 enoyl-CoA hydratase [Paracoccus sp. SM22M-07]
MRHVIIFAAALLLAACQLPKDPEGTTRDVEGKVLIVGTFEEPLPSVDREAVERIAAELEARVELRPGNPHLLLNELSHGDVHLLAGGIPSDSPLAKHAGATNPIGHVTIGPDRVERVLLIRPGENRFLFRLNKALRPLTREARQ